MKRFSPTKAPVLVPPDHTGAMPLEPFVAMIRGADAPLHEFNLPKGLRGQAREKVARRQVADNLGLAQNDVEVRPFLTGADKGLWTRAIVVASDKMATQRGKFAAGRALAILPDYLTLPATTDVWVIEVQDDTVKIRIGLNDGFSGEPDLALLQLAEIQKSAVPRAILRLGGTDAAIDGFLARLNLPILQDAKDFTGDLAPAPQLFAHGELLADLSQNAQAAFYAMKRVFRTWRFFVILVALAVVLWSVSMNLRTAELAESAVETRRQTTQLVRDNFIPTGPILDVRAQVSGAISGLNSQIQTARNKVAPLDLLKSTALVAAAAPTSILGAFYQAGDGLNVTFQTGDFAALDRLVAALEAADIAVTIGQSSASENGEGVTSQLMLSPKGAVK